MYDYRKNSDSTLLDTQKYQKLLVGLSAGDLCWYLVFGGFYTLKSYPYLYQHA
jgi:hypothetical protein